MKASAVVAAVVGATGVGGCGSGESAKEIAQAKRQATQIESNASRSAAASVSAANAKAGAEITAARRKARAILAPIKSDTQRARSELAKERQKLSDAQSQVSAESSKLAGLQAQVNGTSAQVAKDSVPGDGTFLVNKQINPGTYQAAGSSGCYWARLASADTSNIIDNNNSDGPVTVQIQASEFAFEANNCATFHRVGP